MGKSNNVPVGILARTAYAISQAHALGSLGEYLTAKLKDEARRLRGLLPGHQNDLNEENDDDDEVWESIVKIGQR